MKVKELIKLIEKDGWFLVRIKGSHRQFHHPTKRRTVTVAGKESIGYTNWNFEQHFETSVIEKMVS